MSRRVSPHVNTIFEIDYTRVAQLRAKKKKEYADRGVNLTFLAFIAKAAADALRRHPTLNAAVSGEGTILRRDINLGIAVALDWGLIVPVIKHADELALLGLARAINDLGERARAKKLSPDEVQKGTFTITNPGVFGSVIGTPIINQPQAAILCVGSIENSPPSSRWTAPTPSACAPGDAVARLRSPDRGRRRRRPVHGGREEDAPGVPRGRGLRWAHPPVSRVSVRRGSEWSTLRRCGAGTGSPRGAVGTCGCSGGRTRRAFLEFSESRSRRPIAHRRAPGGRARAGREDSRRGGVRARRVGAMGGGQ